uniref:Ig-like domain-containing protein n=1 Tax=Anabas testudineus TaxID=64144 RepID=A0A3Q1JW97_ANATE
MIRLITYPLLTTFVLLFDINAVKNSRGFEVVGSREPVRAEVGDDVVLPCHVRPEFDVTRQTVEWKRERTVVHMFKSRDDNPDTQDLKFRGRTSLFRDKMTQGNISLKLTNVSEADAGNYTCYVPKMESQLNRDNVTLIVADSPSPDPPHLSPGLVSGIMILCLIGLVCLAAGFILCKRQSMCPAQNTRQSDRQYPDKGQDRVDGSPLKHRGQRRQRGQHRQHQQQ